ncbi:MAG: hypothetical protein NC336_03130 [Clostridium sp.]|nr:hypothetical protein [Clostridium sp.]
MTPQQPTSGSKTQHIVRRDIMSVMNAIVLILSIALIVWISFDTFRQVDFLQNGRYMAFQFWVCVVFVVDFFVGLWVETDRWRYFRHRLLFLFLSIPWLNIVASLDIQLSADAIYFVRFIPLARGALAMAIVIGYLSTNAVTSLFMSYLSIMLMITYFCSLIFYQTENGVNPDVTTYWTSLWWTAMNLTTVGCSITPFSVAGKVIAVVLPICGMIMFPLFTVYLTNYVQNNLRRS